MTGLRWSENRTKWTPEAIPTCALASLPVDETASNAGCTSPRARRAHSEQHCCHGASAVSWSAKCLLCARIPTTCASAIGPDLLRLVELLAS